MAINLIASPLADAPINFAGPVINHLNAHLLNVGSHRKISNGFVRKGALFSVGGAMYIADSDTAIAGTNTLAIAVKMTPSGSTLLPSYVSDLTGVTYSETYLGWYDTSNIYYERLYCTQNIKGSYHNIENHYDSECKVQWVQNSAIPQTIINCSISGTVDIVFGMDLYGSFVYDISRSTDGGTTWESIVHQEGTYTRQRKEEKVTRFVEVGEQYKFSLSINTDVYAIGLGMYYTGMRGSSPEDII